MAGNSFSGASAMRFDDELAVELARHIAETRARTSDGSLPKTLDEASEVFGIPKDEVSGYLNEVQVRLKARELAREQSIAAEHSWTRHAWVWFFGGLAAGVLALIPLIYFGFLLQGDPPAAAGAGGDQNLMLASTSEPAEAIGPVPCPVDDLDP